jgi:hypothetical protein
VKARARLDLGGNLKAMLEYVSYHGGYIELWVRSTKHPDGATRLSQPLKDVLNALMNDGKAVVKFYP